MNNVNSNLRFINITNIFFVYFRKDIIIFSLLILFTALSTVLISFSFDLLINGVYPIEKDLLSTFFNDSLVDNKAVTIIFNKHSSDYDNKTFIFNPFIDLFHKTHSTYRYFPSYFQITKGYKDYKVINKTLESLHLNETMVDLQNSKIAREIIDYNQYLILEYENNRLNNLLLDICRIIIEYEQNNIL